MRLRLGESVCPPSWLFHSVWSLGSRSVTSVLRQLWNLFGGCSFGCSVVFWCFLYSKLNKLEQLEELNLSGNKLKTIPTTIANCKRLHTLVAHSNHISIFPEILQLPQIQVLLCAGMVSGGDGRGVTETVLF